METLKAQASLRITGTVDRSHLRVHEHRPHPFPFHRSRRRAQRFLADPANIEAVEQAAAFMSYCLKQGAKVISCGNGGSMCDAMHFAEELTGKFRDDRPPIAAISISDPSHLTCVGNDHGFEQVFARFVQAHGREGDVLLAISTSGNSPNVLRAAEVARARHACDRPHRQGWRPLAACACGGARAAQWLCRSRAGGAHQGDPRASSTTSNASPPRRY
jgi:phosphoheptose isomerase